VKADDLADLVERARLAEEQSPRPPADLLLRGRAAARRRLANLLLVAVVAALVTTGSVFAVSHRGSPDVAATPSAETRLVGAHGVVVAVPSDWETEVEQGSYCGPVTPRMVRFFLPFRGPVGLCAIPMNASWPAVDALTVSTGSLMGADVTPAGDPSGTVAGMPYFVSDAKQTGPGVARSLVVPDAGVRFTVAAATASRADALLATIQLAPKGTTTVAVTTRGKDQHLVLDLAPGEPLRSRVVEAQDPDGPRGELPGQLLRTDPPVGTPIPAGSTVTLVFSAGDLYAYVSNRALAAGGWIVTPADQYTPPITRIQAFQAVPNKYPNGGGGGEYGIYLRRLDGRLVWLVALHVLPQPGLRLTAVDAHTGQVVDDHVFPLLPN
jgi:hypothetical protein